MRRLIATAALALSACGAEPTGQMQVALRQHQMPCDVPGLQAKLEVTGRSEDCPLDVGSDRTITGTCGSIPVGQVLEFRLVYFVQIQDDPMPVDLATALQQLDLTTARGGGQVQLTFQQADLNIMIDDDQDMATNLAEVCSGRNPRGS